MGQSCRPVDMTYSVRRSESAFELFLSPHSILASFFRNWVNGRYMANCVTTRNSRKSEKWKRFFSLSLLTSVFVAVFTLYVSAEERQTRRSEKTREPRSPATAIDDSLQDALRKIPWESLSQTAKAKIKPVITSHSIFRRLPQQAVYADSEMYQFLVEHPDIVVGFWEKLGVTQISLRELSEDRFLMKETGGTTAVAEVLHRTRDLCIIYAKGQYRGSILARPIDGETVLILRSRFLRDEDNDPYTVCQLDSFVRLENVGADLVAKLLSNVLGKIADSNFEQTIGFVGNVSDAAVSNTEKVKDLSSQMKGVRNDVRDDFSDVVDRVASRSSKRGRVFPEYTEIPIPTGHETEPSPFTAYSVPVPIITRQAQPLPTNMNISEAVESEDETPIPMGGSTLVDDAVEPPKSRVVFRKPNVSTAVVEE